MTPRQNLLIPAALLASLALVGCNDSTAPRDRTAPAPPRGLRTITGDGEVLVYWLDNTEADVEGYNVYMAPCARGDDCPYERVGTTSGNQFVVRGLSNGVTRYFSVSAFDEAGNESEPTDDEDVPDTPRPEGSGLLLSEYVAAPATSGYDFSDFAVRAYDSPSTDVFYGIASGVQLIYAPFEDTDIQDAGWCASLDAIDFSPIGGWSPSGTVEVVTGHAYIVRTGDNHYAKFRVADVTPARVVLDWAYQVDPGNRELKVRRLNPSAPRTRRVFPAPVAAAAVR